MKPRIVVIMALAVVMLLASWAVSLAQTDPHPESITYRVEMGSVAGEGYQLINLTWQVNGGLRGAGYLMLDPAAPALRGSGCCCNYLPCVLRNR